MAWIFIPAHCDLPFRDRKRLAAARAHRLQNRKLKRAGTHKVGDVAAKKKGPAKRGYTQFSPKWAKVRHELVDKKRLSRLVEAGQSAEAVALAARRRSCRRTRQNIE